jgi:hypothetical protein
MLWVAALPRKRDEPALSHGFPVSRTTPGSGRISHFEIEDCAERRQGRAFVVHSDREDVGALGRAWILQGTGGRQGEVP